MMQQSDSALARWLGFLNGFMRLYFVLMGDAGWSKVQVLVLHT